MKSLSALAVGPALAAAIALSAAAHGAQPYYTDDAAVAERGACQLEFTSQVNRGSRDRVLLPACNLVANLELTLGGSQAVAGEHRDTLYVAQAKGLFRALEGGYATGWVAGARWREAREPAERKLSNYYASLLLTRSLLDDALIAHVNLGAQTDRDRRQESITWGVNAELPLRAGFTLIGEIFSNERSRSFHQVGLRYAIVPDHLEIDTSVGGANGHRAATRWWTIGLRLVSAPLLR